MSRPPKTSEDPQSKPLSDAEAQSLGRHLFERSAVFTRAAHALEAAANQLRQAHCRDFAKAAAEAQSASMVAMHAALSAHQLVGAYETAAWLERERAKPSDQ
ncbi:MAG: hypothetical protein QM784_14915 [Polyangiaceae bacterium]